MVLKIHAQRAEKALNDFGGESYGSDMEQTGDLCLRIWPRDKRAPEAEAEMLAWKEAMEGVISKGKRPLEDTEEPAASCAALPSCAPSGAGERQQGSSKVLKIAKEAVEVVGGTLFLACYVLAAVA